MTTRPIDRLVNLAVSAVESLLAQEKAERASASGSSYITESSKYLSMLTERSMLDELDLWQPEPSGSYAPGSVHAVGGSPRSDFGRVTLTRRLPPRHSNVEENVGGFKRSKKSEEHSSWMFPPYVLGQHSNSADLQSPSVSQSEHVLKDSTISSADVDSDPNVSVTQRPSLTTTTLSVRVADSSRNPSSPRATVHRTETWPIHAFRDENGVERY